jgi:hypothetical protein
MLFFEKLRDQLSKCQLLNKNVKTFESYLNVYNVIASKGCLKAEARAETHSKCQAAAHTSGYQSMVRQPLWAREARQNEGGGGFSRDGLRVISLMETT